MCQFLLTLGTIDILCAYVVQISVQMNYYFKLVSNRLRTFGTILITQKFE